MSQPIYRLAEFNDYNELIRLRVLMQGEVSDTVTPYSEQEYREKMLSYFAQGFTDGSHVGAVAEIDKKLVSMNAVIIYQKPPALSGGTGRNGYLSSVYTEVAWRRRGLAHDLLKFAVNHCKSIGVDKIHLGTTTAGRGLYEKLSFSEPRTPQLELRLKDYSRE